MVALNPPAVLTAPAEWGVGVQVPVEVFQRASEEALLVELETHERIGAWLEARSLAVIQELSARREREALAELDERDPHAPARVRTLTVNGAREAVTDEIALATGAGQRACQTRVRMAREWERFTPIRDALAAGDMSWSRALQVSIRTNDVDSGRIRGIVDAVLAPDNARRTPDGEPDPAGGLAVPQSLFSWRLGRAVAAATTSRQRHLDALQRRDMWATTGPDADGSLTVTGHAARIAAAFGRVDDTARRLRHHGDTRTLAQLRSDITLDLLIIGHPNTSTTSTPGTASGTASDLTSGIGKSTGTATSADPRTSADGAWFAGALPPARVTVTISAASLLGANHAAGTLDLRAREEHLPAHVIRDLALSQGSLWRRLVTDPMTGHMLDLTTHRYEVTGELRQRVQARDRYSRVPGSMRPATGCDTDHDINHADGGPTSMSNISAKNRRGHNHKTHHHWTSTREPEVNGSITWTTHTGRHYLSHPHDYRDPPPAPVTRATSRTGDPHHRQHHDAVRAEKVTMLLARARHHAHNDPDTHATTRAAHLENTGGPITRPDTTPAFFTRHPHSSSNSNPPTASPPPPPPHGVNLTSPPPASPPPSPTAPPRPWSDRPDPGPPPF